MMYNTTMPKRVNYNVDEIMKVLNETKSWRAVDSHFNRGNGVVKTWCKKNNIKIKEVHYFKIQNTGD